LVFRGPRAGVEAARARLVDDSHLQIVLDSHLTRQPDVLRKPRLQRESVALKLAHLARVACKNFDAAGRTLRVPAAAVQYVNASVLNREHELSARPRLKLADTICGLRLDPRHARNPPAVWKESRRVNAFGLRVKKTETAAARAAPSATTVLSQWPRL